MLSASVPHQELGDTAVITVGVVDGADAYVFGRIGDVAVTDDGEVVVLDQQTFRVSLFDAEGRFVDRGGEAGGGPREFRAPVAVEALPDRRIAVLDAARRRIVVFRHGPAAGFEVDTTRSVDAFADDLCSIDGRWFILAWSDGNLIHEIDEEGALVSSFAPLVTEVPPELKRHSQLLRDTWSRGKLLCDSTRGRIYLAQEHAPSVRAFDLDGALLWSTILGDFRQRGWEPVGNGLRMTADPQSGSAHTVVGLGLVQGQALAVSIRETSLRDVAGTLEWRMINAETGEQTTRISATDVLVRAQPGARYVYRNDPFPQATMVRW
jgi:hypothetical protein